MSVRELTPELAEKARLELNEDPKRLADGLQHIKEWLSKQPHLRARTDDQWLAAFLRGSKYSLERTKEKLDLYYSLRSTAPEMFKVKYNDITLKEILDLGCLVVLPKTSAPDAPRISLMRPGAYDPSKYTIMEVMGALNHLQMINIMEDDNTVIAGQMTVLDLEGVTVGHLLQMTPMQMKKMVVLSQDAAPLRMKGAHYLHTPPGFETVFNAIKGMLNEKNKNRLFVHNKNYEALYKHIPKDILPAEYGGNAGTLKELADYWKKKVEEYSSFFEEDLKYGSDEVKRPGKPKTAEDMFGVEGSFRQLEFD